MSIKLPYHTIIYDYVNMFMCFREQELQHGDTWAIPYNNRFLISFSSALATPLGAHY